MMKTLVLLFLSTLSIAQIDVNAEDAYPYWESGDIYNIRNINDPNHFFERYVGSWIGTYESRNYHFKIVEHVRHPSFNPDSNFRMLKVTYNVTDANGNYLAKFICPEDELCAEGPGIDLGYILEDGVTYKSYYFGGYTACGNSGFLYLKYKSEQNLELVFEKRPFSKYECKDGSPFLMPKGDTITLTKR